MDQSKLVQLLQGKCGKDLAVVQEYPDLVAQVEVDKLIQVCLLLRDTPGLNFNFLLFVTAVDKGDYLEVVYGLRSLISSRQLMLKVAVPAVSPRVPSVTSVWPAADWDERETYDLFGVCFDAHPNLARILLPEDWEGHPLRKSYPLKKRPAAVI